MHATAILEREEIGTNPNLETLDSDEKIVKYIEGNIAKLEQTQARIESLGQGCGHMMVDLMVFENNAYKDDQEKLIERTKVIARTVKAFAIRKGEDPKAFVDGFMAEAAVTMALNKLGFTVLASTSEEDKEAKIDMYVVDQNEKDDPFALAVQVKNSAEVRQLFVHALDKNPEPLLGYIDLQNIRDSEEFKSKLAYSTSCMLQYLSHHKELFRGRIIPLVVIIPGGEGSDDPSYNMSTCTPVPGFEYNLFDELQKKNLDIWRKDDKE